MGEIKDETMKKIVLGFIGFILLLIAFIWGFFFMLTAMYFI